jgi:ATP-dependent Clp protease ATP-binding subunit ClpC
MFDRLTERALRVIFFARYEVSKTGSDTVTTEHFLLGLMRENRHLVAEIPPTVDLASLRATLFGSRPAKDVPTSIDIGLSDSAQRALQQAERECDSKDGKITSGHLLLGILGQVDTLAAGILERYGIGRELILARMPNLAEEQKPLDPNSFPDLR